MLALTGQKRYMKFWEQNLGHLRYSINKTLDPEALSHGIYEKVIVQCFTTGGRMHPNISNHERLFSFAVGCVAIVHGFLRKSSSKDSMQKVAGFAMLLRGWSGYCPVYRVFHRPPLHTPHDIERSIVIDKPFEVVRSMVDEGDPLLHEGSRKIFPITAGYLLWDFQLESIGDGRMTHIKATLSDRNESFELKTDLSRKVLKSLADNELGRIKELIESDSNT